MPLATWYSGKAVHRAGWHLALLNLCSGLRWIACLRSPECKIAFSSGHFSPVVVPLLPFLLF